LASREKQAHEARKLAEIPEAEFDAWKAAQNSRTLTVGNALRTLNGQNRSGGKRFRNAREAVTPLLAEFSVAEILEALDELTGEGKA
jgi:hypothetical protein